MRLISLALLAVTTTACGNDSAPPPPPVVADPPSIYVAKVKNILVGLAPSDAEIAAVTADPTALGGLVDGWMTLPEYQQKMMVFFELAFQQTQISEADFVDLVPPRGLGVGRSVPLLVQNVRESFARTVLELEAEGRPLTDAFSTDRLMMTPALMELYAFMDTRHVDDAAAITDAFQKANPGLKITLETAQGPIPIAQTLDPTNANYMHWYAPGLPATTYNDPTCNGMDPIVFGSNALFLHALLYGEIPPHPGTTNPCPQHVGVVGTAQVTDADFTAWKMVTVRQPAAGEARTTFYDLPSLRTATELVVGTRHLGFFSTPAFFANWPTNQSNQMRVTLNQALIVSTGAAIDGTDSTSPSTTPGLDATHAAPGTACFTCHQLLDPTRSILSSTYSWFYYPQSDTTLLAQPGLFAFQSVIAPMQTIDDFAHQLASHPLVPAGWVQKLCYYVNSAPCDPTATGDKNGEVIAVSRRDHLCAALNNRLGFVDICQLDITYQSSRMPSTIAQIVSGLPSDGYGRGATIPVLPNQPTLFYRAGLENICEAVATMVVDGKANPNQPGAKQWSSSQPDAAIADFVAIIMAMSSSDARAAPATTVLKSHFTAAVATGASPTDSLRSTFIAACLAPSFIGIGM